MNPSSAFILFTFLMHISIYASNTAFQFNIARNEYMQAVQEFKALTNTPEFIAYTAGNNSPETDLLIKNHLRTKTIPAIQTLKNAFENRHTQEGGLILRAFLQYRNICTFLIKMKFLYKGDIKHYRDPEYNEYTTDSHS